MGRAYATYNPLRTFAVIGGILAFVGFLPLLRFVALWAMGNGDGHVQSLVIGGALLVLGALTGLMGVLAELIGANRKLLEASLHKLRMLEERFESLDNPPAQSGADNAGSTWKRRA
ncbi:MAG: glycosyltransferase family 2 protein, partial [Pseudomonadota bacterium]